MQTNLPEVFRELYPTSFNGFMVIDCSEIPCEASCSLPLQSQLCSCYKEHTTTVTELNSRHWRESLFTEVLVKCCLVDLRFLALAFRLKNDKKKSFLAFDVFEKLKKHWTCN